MYVQMTGSFKCDPFYVAKRKKHDSILIMCTKSGKGVLKYENKSFETTEGTGIIINCNKPHVYFTDKNDLWNFMWVHFNGGQCIKQVEFILNNAGPIFIFEKGSTIEKNIQKIIELTPKKGMYYDILASNYLNEILTDLMLNALPKDTNVKSTPDLIKNAISILEQKYQENIDLEYLAKRLFTNKYNLIRQFKKYQGITPYEYLIKFRINQAKFLLENTSLTVSEISFKSGFGDSSHFIKLFRKYVKKTPLQYRKIWNIH